MEQNKYIDTSAGLYTDNYPILSLSDRDTFENYEDDSEGLLKDCVWFQCASEAEKKGILDKLKVTSGLVEDIKIIIGTKYPDLHIKHISIGGSYLFKIDEANDIDFNIIVAGSHFSYVDIFEVDNVNKKLPVSVKKISLMIFGEDDFLFRTNIYDTIETEDYIHTSLCMREGLVFPMRNVLIYGHLCQPKDLDRRNLLVRIKRQLFHAQLMIEGKVDLHRNADARLLKSVGRIAEAFLYLSVGFTQLKMSPENILEKEKILSKSLHRADIISWLQEADNCIKSLSDQVNT
jgi:hypothetical protein